MANRERGEIKFTVGETAYVLKLTTGAMAELEDACSTADKPMTFPEILERVMRGSVKYLRLYVWAALLEKQPTMTVKATSELIDEMGGVAGLWEVLSKLSDTSKPDPEDARPQTAQATTPKRGTGGRSTSKPVTSA